MFTRNLNGKDSKVHKAEKVKDENHKEEDKDQGVHRAVSPEQKELQSNKYQNCVQLWHQRTNGSGVTRKYRKINEPVN